MGVGTGGGALAARDTGLTLVHYLSAQLVFGDNGTAKVVGILPAGCAILRISALVTTAFNDSGTDQITVGTTTTANEYVSSAMDVSSVGLKSGTLVTPGTTTITTADTTVYAKYAGQNSNMTAGAAYVIVEYLARPTA